MPDGQTTTAKRDALDPLIITAAFDAGTSAMFQRLRDAHFPRALNVVPAHLTLFHALPGALLGTVAGTLAREAASRGVLPFAALETRLLGRGVAFAVECPALARLRQGLATRWSAHLTAQDKAGFRPHVTVQNKVAPETARALRPRLDALLPFDGAITGLRLWHYRGGPWEGAGVFSFAADGLAGESAS